MHKTLLPSNESLELKQKDIAYRDSLAEYTGYIDLDPMTCDARLLPYLAQVYQVLYWDELWSEVVKRKFIANAPMVHRHIGTKWALETILELTDLSDGDAKAEIKEGMNIPFADGKYIADGLYFAGGGTWANYVVYVYKSITIQAAVKARKLIEVYTPVHTKLVALVYGKALTADGSFIADGTYTAGIIGVENV